jgi:signal transduction histidine kinase
MVSQFNDTENVSKIESLLQIAIDDTRRISRDLYPTVLKVSGLKAALGNLFENLQHANKLMEFDFDMAELDYSLGDSFSLHIYRICQELTNNTIKYANAKNAVLEIDFDELTMLLRYRDNGIGIDMSNYKTGVGMNSIQERLAALDGQINIISTPGTGFEVRIRAPLEVSAISKEN